MSDKPRNFATVTIPSTAGTFEAWTDGLILRARLANGSWIEMVLPSQDEDTEAIVPSAKRALCEKCGCELRLQPGGKQGHDKVCPFRDTEKQ